MVYSYKYVLNALFKQSKENGGVHTEEIALCTCLNLNDFLFKDLH